MLTIAWMDVLIMTVVRCSGNALVLINEVNLFRAWLWQLVLGWVTTSRFNSWCRIFISVCNQQARSTQPGHPFVDRCNKYQPKGDDALWQVWFMCGWQVASLSHTQAIS